jgi:hypothetical protein
VICGKVIAVICINCNVVCLGEEEVTGCIVQPVLHKRAELQDDVM